MTIFVRTSLGNAAIRSNNDPGLTRRLRSLLIAIDGKADSRIYIASLSANIYGDVAGLLESLRSAGMIRAVGSVETSGGMAVADLPFIGSQLVEAAPVTRIAPVVAVVAFSQADVLAPLPDESATQTAEKTRAAVALMSDFVENHVPSDMNELMFAIDQLSTPKEVLAMLPDYAQQLTPLTAQGQVQAHISELRTLLTSQDFHARMT